MRIRFRIQLINFDADPDADPDPGYQNDADPQHCAKFIVQDDSLLELGEELPASCGGAAGGVWAAHGRAQAASGLLHGAGREHALQRRQKFHRTHRV